MSEPTHDDMDMLGEGKPEITSPSLPPEYAYADPAAVQQQLDEQAERLAQPAANVDMVGMPHFLRNVNGEEVCGGCGNAFPCPAYGAMTRQSALLEGLAPAAELLPTMTEAAQAAGMDLDEFAARLRQTRRQ